MKNARFLLTGMAIVSALGLSLAISRAALAGEGELSNTDIARDNTDINNIEEGLPDDTYAVKADRQALKDAIASGDKEKIKEARRALRADLKVKDEIKKDIEEEEKEKRRDKRRTHKGNTDRSKDALNIKKNTLEINRNTLDLNKDTLGIRKNKLDLRKNSFDLKKSTYDLNRDMF
jgi:hypothetical protein